MRGEEDKNDLQEQPILKFAGLEGYAEAIHQIALDHGWYDNAEGKHNIGARNVGEMMLLMNTEVAEAFEEWREGKPGFYLGKDGKPEGVVVELMDCVIRILDFCRAKYPELNLDDICCRKIAYNESRPYRHGGKLA